MFLGISTGLWVVIGILIGAFAAGLFGIPLLVMLLGPSLPSLKLAGPLGRLHWILAAIGMDRTVAVVEENGAVELCPAEEDRVWYDGEWHPLGDGHNWTRLGLRPFGVTYVKDDAVYGDLLAEDTTDTAVADGGDIGIIDREGGGYRFFTNHPDGSGDDEYLIDMPAVTSRLHGVGDNSLLQRGKDIGLQKHGGDSQLDMKWFIGGIVMSAATGYALATIQLVFV